MMKNSLYPLGFLFCADGAKAPENFKRIDFHIPFWVHPKTNYSVCRCSAGSVVIIGEAVYPLNPELNLQGIASLICLKWANRQNEVDMLVGRFFILFVSADGEIRVQNDAIGMRSAFYWAGDTGVIVGSHASLVAASLPEAKEPRPLNHALGYPGLYTLYPDIFRLPPSCELSLTDGRLHRFFPGAVIPETDMGEVWDLAFSRASAACAALAMRKKILMSLTGGLDSRTTLAATRNLWKDITFFTYNRGHDGQMVDYRVAAAISSRLGLRHLYLDYLNYHPDPDLMRSIQNNVFTSHQHKLSCFYHLNFGEYNYLHLRTNFLELARSNLYYKAAKKGVFPGGPRTAEEMARYYSEAGGVAPAEHILSAFQDYVEKTDFVRVVDLASAWDMYFVEHRMGAWHAGAVLESDIAFDTVIAFNSREILKAFMGIPQQERSQSRYLYERLIKMIPEISDIPVNPKTYPVKF